MRSPITCRFGEVMRGAGVRIVLPYDLHDEGPHGLLVAPGGTFAGHRAVGIALEARALPHLSGPGFATSPGADEVLAGWERELRIGYNDPEAYERDKRSWIESGGSPHLRSGYARGYPMQDAYLSERVAAEVPGWDCLIDPPSAIGSVSPNPSPAALSLLALVEAELDLAGAAYREVEVVGLVRAPAWRSCRHVGEAIVIRAWLGRHGVWVPVPPGVSEAYV